VLNKIWEDWKKFASYAFNKSHATCYSWVAYQTAYLKAHYPAEYMAAVMSRNFNNITEVTKLMDECRSMGIPTLGPDINESRSSFSANRAGDIRFGLAGISGVGGAAVEQIIAEREQNGPFESIFDFVQRVNSRTCNRKMLEAFAQSGAFDCFKEINREDFFVVNERGEVFSDVLMRFGQSFQSSKMSIQNSLFGGLEDEIEVNTPEIVHGTPWPDLERLDKERKLVGIYLSAHPLDPYYIEVKYGCNTQLSELDDKSDLLDQELTMAGLVVDYQEKMSQKGGKFGIIKIEDYSGSHEFRLFRQQFIDYAKYGQTGVAVFIRGMYQKNRYNDNIQFNITSMQLLENVKGTLMRNIQ
jgi:DNA polymerase-3 subunit alpha